MGFPKLVRPEMRKTQITLEMDQEGVNEYGEPLGPFVYSGKCNYQDGAKTVLSYEKKDVQITGSALFDGDICPQLAVISGGKAVVFGQTRRIYQGRKGRNPDGSVNFTEVILI